MATKTLTALAVMLILLGFLWKGLFLNTKQSFGDISQLPSFNLASISKEETLSEFTSSTLKGKYTILSFWASWCSSCNNTHKLYPQIASDKLQIIGVALRDEPEQVKHYLKKIANPYDVVLLDETGELAVKLGLHSTPETILVNPTGKIIARYRGAMNLAIWQAHFARFVN